METTLRYDVFNGDADGICALHQLRLHTPAEATLVSGVKRDIELLRRVPDCAADILVLDISLDSNARELRRLLTSGAEVNYFDHHCAELAFSHPRLHLHCDDSPDVCTSVLVDRYLGGRYRPWAVSAAFGDNLTQQARQMALRDGLTEDAITALEELGQVINYNAYGECVEDLHMAPTALYRALSGYHSPFDFIATSDAYRTLRIGYREDCAHMEGIRPHWAAHGNAIYMLPATIWARRISGVLANRLAAQHPGTSFAVLHESSDASYQVSVRSGSPSERSACGLCQQFDSGGGRKTAAGINRLPASDLGKFVNCFRRYFTVFAVLNNALFLCQSLVA